ncbi:MAG: VIT family protein, partial [Thermoanaerobaculia bacterium]
MAHGEFHKSDRIGWLRAAVLGANDGLISTGSLVVGVASSGAARAEVMVAAIAGMVAGALSMAAGEYVSVGSQADTEQADLARERRELAETPEAERAELAGIYVARGLSPELAAQVADQLMAKDALGAHARDELGMSETTRAWAPSASFAM